MSWIYGLDLFGTAVFAVSGSLAAGNKRMDLFGVCVLAAVTALGGGTLRDIILGARPVFWVGDPVYIFVVLAAALGTFAAIRFVRLPKKTLLVADAIGLAVFTVIGAKRALACDAGEVSAVIMAMMTGCAGGIMRDVLAGEIPLILQKEIYAVASLAGAVVLVVMAAHWPGWPVNTCVSVGLVLAIRLAAIRWNLSLPILSLDKMKA